MKRMPITFHWDFDFQGQFEADVPNNRKPYLAIAGGLLHDDFFGGLITLYEEQGAYNMRKKHDFIKYRDRGFSIERSIRGSDGKAVKAFDEKLKREMIAMPDVVDYRNDEIIDLKTYYLREPPDKGGHFVTVEDLEQPADDSNASLVPEGYEDAWADLRRMVESEIYNKYNAQLNRYSDAYFKATGRVPAVNVFVVLYALTRTYEHDQSDRGINLL